MERILLPVDISHPEKVAEIFAEAKKIAANREVSLTVIHIISPMPGLLSAELPAGFAERVASEVEARVSALVKEHNLDPSTEVVVRSGVPQHEIVSIAKEQSADLIIIASHKPGIADYLLGSVAAAVVRHAPCSVLVKR